MALQFRVDGRIRAREVRVVDADGSNIGVLSLRDALNRAMSKGLNLVEIAPNAQPPVCRIIDLGKFRYELAKKEKESRKHQHANRLKELEFHVNISEHDYQTKLRHAEDFLRKGCKVKACVTFRGREMAHQDLGRKLIERFIHDCAPISTADSMPRMLGRRLHVMLTATPASKRPKPAPEPTPTNANPSPTPSPIATH